MTKFKLVDVLLTFFRCAITCTVFFQGSALAQSSLADKLDGYVSIGNADVYRGVMRNEHDIAVQAALRFELVENVHIGAHLSPAEFFAGPGKTKKEIEFSHYLSWSFWVTEEYAMQLRFTRYTYPGSSDTFFEYDYNELLASIDYSSGLSLAVSVFDSGLAFANGYAYAQAGYARSLPQKFEFSAAIGGLRSFNAFSGSYGYWDVGVSRPFGKIMADLRYHDSPRERRWFGRPLADKQWVLSLTRAW